MKSGGAELLKNSKQGILSDRIIVVLFQRLHLTSELKEHISRHTSSQQVLNFVLNHIVN